MTQLLPTDPRAAVFVALLTEARRIVFSREQKHVCTALFDASETLTGEARGDAVDALVNWINSPIMRDDPIGGGDVGSWLIARGIPQADVSGERLRVYRLRWIDAMIDYFEVA
jgi:hypothetical protein